MITENAAIPFVVTTGQEEKASDFKGVTMDMMKARFFCFIVSVYFFCIAKQTSNYTVDRLHGDWPTYPENRTTVEISMFSHERGRRAVVALKPVHISLLSLGSVTTTTTTAIAIATVLYVRMALYAIISIMSTPPPVPPSTPINTCLFFCCRSSPRGSASRTT